MLRKRIVHERQIILSTFKGLYTVRRPKKAIFQEFFVRRLLNLLMQNIVHILW